MFFHDLKEGLQERTWNPDFSECVVYSVLLTVKSAFHMVSILLTMSLSILKSLAIMFPIRSRNYLTARPVSIWSLSLCFLSGTLFSFVLKDELSNLKNDYTMCIRENGSSAAAVTNFEVYIYTAVSIIIIICTLYLVIKLVCMRSIGESKISGNNHGRNRRSVLVVVVICIVYLTSEGINIYMIITWMIFRNDIQKFRINKPWEYTAAKEYMSYISYRNEKVINSNVIMYQYLDLSLLVGFSINFFIYLIMGSQVRQLVFNQFSTFKSCFSGRNF